MTQPTLSVLDSTGTTRTINTVLNVGQTTMANSSPVTLASDQSALPITGTVTSTISGTVPVSGTFYQATQPVSEADGSNVTIGSKADVAWTTGSGSLVSIGKAMVNAINAPLPAGTNALGSVTVTSAPTTAVTGTFWQTTQPVSGTVTANISGSISNTGFANTSFVSQGSTTSGQTGGLIQGAVTTSAPAYTTAQTSPLSLTTGGSLRSDVSSYAGTALTGTVTAYGTAPTGNVYGVNAYVTAGTIGTVTNVSTVAAVTNLAKIGGNIPAYSIAAGSTNLASAVSIATSVSQTDVTSGAFAGAGQVVGTVISSAQGGGAVITSLVNISALTLGTATGVVVSLQDSADGASFTDVWVSDLITATGNIRVPSVVVGGRRRWRFFSVGGTSTTVTATITTQELPPGSYPWVRQFRDFYSATNPYFTQNNGSNTTASSLVLTTASSFSSVFNIDGCKAVTAHVSVTGGTPTTNPVLTLQISQDGVNFANTTVTLTPTSASTYMASLANTPARFARFIVSTASSGGTAYTLTSLGVYGAN